MTVVGYEALTRVDVEPERSIQWWLDIASEHGLRSQFEVACWRAVTQIGLSIVCLIGAGLLLRTLTKLHQEDVGFNRDHVLVGWIFPTLAGYEGQKETTLYWNLLDKLNATPGVASASLFWRISQLMRHSV